MVIRAQQLVILVICITYSFARGMEENDPRFISCTKIEHKLGNSKIINIQSTDSGKLRLGILDTRLRELTLNNLDTRIEDEVMDWHLAQSKNGDFVLCWNQFDRAIYVSGKSSATYLNYKDNVLVPKGTINDHGNIFITTENRFLDHYYVEQPDNDQEKPSYSTKRYFSNTVILDGRCDTLAFGNRDQKLLAFIEKKPSQDNKRFLVFIKSQDNMFLRLWNMRNKIETASTIKLPDYISQIKKLELTSNDAKACLMYDTLDNTQAITVVNLSEKNLASTIMCDQPWIWHTFCLGKNTAKNGEILQICAKKKNEEDNIYIISYALKYNVLLDKVRNKFNNIYFSFNYEK